MKSVLLFLLSLHLAQSVRVDVDTSRAPQLYDFGFKTKQILEQWYPNVNYILRSPTGKKVDRIYVTFDPNYKGVAEAAGNRIRGSVDFFTRNQNDYEAMIHEMAHVIQNYRKYDGWVTEGIADWVRYFHYEPSRGVSMKPQGNQHYTNGYGVTAYFLNWINKNRYQHMVYFPNKDCREGTYNVNIFQKLTGKTVDQLWQEMLRDSRG